MRVERWQRELDVAFAAVRDAAMLARGIRQQLGGEAVLKPDRSPVTVADFAVQALVATRLRQAFPGDPMVAEEDAALLRTAQAAPILGSVLDVLQRMSPGIDADRVFSAIDCGVGSPDERFWTLDPIDGTRGFVRGDQYVVALALVVRGHVEIGVLGCPRLSPSRPDADAVGSIVFAVRDQGAFGASLTGGELTRLRVSARAEPRLARVLRSYEGAHIDANRFNDVVRTLRIEIPPLLMDSQAKHAVIAAGRAEVLLRLPARPEFRDKIWDQAAGALIVEEAGGRVTDTGGAELDFAAGRTLARNVGVVASNGHVHDAVIAALRARCHV